MYYIKLTTLEYPKHIGDIWLEHPELTGQMDVCPPTYAKVHWIDPPNYNPETQEIYQDSPLKNINSTYWIMHWKVRDLTEKEIEEKKEHQEKIKSMFDKNYTLKPPDDVQINVVKTSNTIPTIPTTKL